MSDVPVLVPEGKDAQDLTLGELDAASYHLKADVADCLTGAAPGKRYAATIELLYRWARRNDTKVKRDDFREYSLDDAAHALGWDREPAGENGAPDPTSAGDRSDSSGSP